MSMATLGFEGIASPGRDAPRRDREVLRGRGMVVGGKQRACGSGPCIVALHKMLGYIFHKLSTNIVFVPVHSSSFCRAQRNCFFVHCDKLSLHSLHL